MPRRSLAAACSALLACACEAPPAPPPPPRLVPLLGGRSLLEASIIEFSSSADAQPLRLERQASGAWRLVHPIRDTLAPEALQALGRTLASIVLEVPAATGSSEAPPPPTIATRAFLEATFADRQVRIEVGQAAAGRPGWFAGRVGDEVGIVPDALLAALQPAERDLRARAVFEAPATIDKIRLEWRSGTTALTCQLQRSGALWRYEGRLPPAAVPAAELAAATLNLQTNGRVALPGGTPTVKIQLEGPHGVQDLALIPEEGGWAGVQAHRDQACRMVMPVTLLDVLRGG